MSLIDEAARNASLDANYGANKAAHMPASHQLALFTDNPANGGVEITGGGYGRVTVTNNGTNWPAAASGAKVGVTHTFPTSTGAWTGTAKWWVLIDGSTRWDAAPLTQEVVVAAAGAVVKVRPTINYEDVL